MKVSNKVIYVKLLLTTAFWGGTFSAGRMVAQHIPPASASFLRFAIASVFLAAITWKVEGKWPRLNLKQFTGVTLLGLTGVFAYNIFFFKGLSIIEASRASLIIATYPICITIASVVLFRVKLTWLKVIGILTSVTGAMIVISKGNLRTILAGGVGTGELCILACVLCWVIYSLIGKSVMKTLSPLVSVTYSTIIGAACLFIPACHEGLLQNILHHGASDWLNLAYLGFFGTVIGFVWFYEGLKHVGPVKSGQFINFVPIFGLLIAAVILSEPMTFSLLVGAALVIGGVYLNTRK